ncbi:hypothetical protein [Demequina sp. NBRC 110055]|uniref:hypothetical protein n=1 Tax=Demequina sp. NBRC 110055 TaxID=1570344 RepID=UPI000A03B4A2|nr:hypothetical protein [Demequina sp. NBRC 110055]
MAKNRLITSASRTAGLALVTDGVVGLAVPGQREKEWAVPRKVWRRSVRRVVGEAVESPAFAVVEIVVGLALVAVVPRVLARS